MLVAIIPIFGVNTWVPGHKCLGVLAYPAQATSGSPGLVQDWRRVHKCTTVHLAHLLLNVCQECFEFALDDKMVILPIGILGDLIRVLSLLLGGEVIVQQGDDGFGTRNQFARIEPLVKMVFHIGHFPLHPIFQPGFKAGRFLFQECSC